MDLGLHREFDVLLSLILQPSFYIAAEADVQAWNRFSSWSQIH